MVGFDVCFYCDDIYRTASGISEELSWKFDFLNNMKEGKKVCITLVRQSHLFLALGIVELNLHN